ncbi:FoF1 ATP synthase subunit gamma [Vibrio sp. CAU 1672]|uniref:F0F1 ATP synthase subunit gamma n=1 Tax=Vibrio sp. CAU 1672 TaxID=3032594 RepID=UPI0023DA73B4|nr:FoF1 ATP synthase subunit gamma [Vibrio sp. CAU 1672]MDF2155776.1 F0F1 ATP synthase subunit gamma [Vibrio sp. CAU 1672]
MTNRQGLQHHRDSVNEIINILKAMKTLAYMENHKLGHYLEQQHQVVDAITSVAEDFLSFYPETLPTTGNTTSVYLIVGSERGFCGGFNQELIQHVEGLLDHRPDAKPHLIVVGRKLFNLMPEDIPVLFRINGPSVAEEVPVVLEQTVQSLAELQQQHPLLRFHVVYHSTGQGVVMKQLLPSFQGERFPPRFPAPPELNLAPTSFLLEVTEQYLFAALHELFYMSLVEESHNRIIHLEGAVTHLDTLAEKLTQQFNILRREEIIEEIEVILLNDAGMEGGKPK